MLYLHLLDGRALYTSLNFPELVHKWSHYLLQTRLRIITKVQLTTDHNNMYLDLGNNTTTTINLPSTSQKPLTHIHSRILNHHHPSFTYQRQSTDFQSPKLRQPIIRQQLKRLRPVVGINKWAPPHPLSCTSYLSWPSPLPCSHHQHIINILKPHAYNCLTIVDTIVATQP